MNRLGLAVPQPLGFLPFIAGSIIKAIAAGITAWGITPKQAYNREADRGEW